MLMKRAIPALSSGKRACCAVAAAADTGDAWWKFLDVFSATRISLHAGAIQKLLHFAVSDVSDDVRRAAVINLGFVLLNVPEQTPRIVSLLVCSLTSLQMCAALHSPPQPLPVVLANHAC